MKKNHKIVMLPTEKASCIYIDKNDKDKLKSSMNVPQAGNAWPNQHLFIISDDEIKEGDWFLSLFGSYPLQNCKGGFDMYPCDLSEFKKIVATTDKSLTDCSVCDMSNGDHKMSCKTPSLRTNLAAIPTAFVEAYIKAYNDGSPITEIDLEMETYSLNQDEVGFSIKTRPDNTVIVHQSKIYTKKEVEKLCEKAFRAGREAQSNLNGNKCPSAWIQDNL